MSYEYRNYIGGGIGSRLGAEVPKQFVEVLGKPILAYTIDAFQQHPDIDAALVVCLESHMEQMLGLIDKVEPHTTTLMYKLGWPVYLSRGSQTNIKITTKEDLELFRAYAYYRSIGNLQKPKVKSGTGVAKTQG